MVDLEVVIVAGEACPRDLPARSAERLPDVRLYNEYGPTEASVWCVACECADLDPTRPVPIGRPIANTYVRLLDARGDLFNQSRRFRMQLAGFTIDKQGNGDAPGALT